MAVGECRRLVPISKVRIGGRDRPGSREVIERRTIVSVPPVRAGERAKEIAVLASARLGRTENLERLCGRALPRQRRAKTDARVDITGMILQRGAEYCFCFVGPAEPQIEPGNPQPRL